jgi:hypothetical protein
MALVATGPHKITYNISAFSAMQMKKSKSKRGDPLNDFMQLSENCVWDTMKAQILVKISELLQPKTIDYDDYSVSFSIACHLPQPMPLNSAEKYNYMLERALKNKTDPAVKVIVEGRAPKSMVSYQHYTFLLVSNHHTLMTAFNSS